MKTKKLLSVILSLVITISSLSFAAVSASAAQITPVTPQKDTGGVYQIGTAEELYGFAQLVNSGAEPSASAVLTADITVNKNLLSSLEFDENKNVTNGDNFVSWTPIGTDYDHTYTGKFDGQGHTISGLYFNAPSTDYVGLFGYLAENGEIKNVGVIDSYFVGCWRLGGVCGWNDSGTITGCYNTGTVSGSEFVGGVCGHISSNGKITDCYNTGTVSGSSNVGGVCGLNEFCTITGCYNTGTVSSSCGYVGGVCGRNENGTITNCYNSGEVSGEYYVGGVCGLNMDGTITGCYNTGTVSGTGSSSQYIGGVCGSNECVGKITGCYNTSTVSGSNRVGGVCGYNSGRITGCYNTSTVSGSNHVGGVCGYNESKSTITGCYTNSGGVYGYNNGTVKDCEEYTGDEFKDGTVCALLNKAIGSSYDVTFYQGEEIPLFFSKTENRYCTVNYAVDPTYTVTIPQTVTLGQTATIKADDVLLDEDKQLEVYLTGTSETDNAFKVKSAEGAELEYTVNDGTKDISIDETVLTVNPDNSANGSATLKFNAPSDSDIIYAGKYTGTVTFTVSVADTQNS